MQNLYFVTQSLLDRKISRLSAGLLLAAMLATLAGCGSGQAIPQVYPVAPSPTGGPAVATVQLLAGSTQVASSGLNTVDLTAIVLSSSKQTISGATVTFSPGTDSTAFINNVSAGGVSDANGVVTAKLNVGGNKANRTIAISASSESATATNSVDVTGTTVTISGTSSLALNAKTTLTFSVKDSAGSPLQGITVAVASQKGNTIALTPSTGITNSSGQITADVTAINAGNDVITATAAGASATQNLTISSASFAFTAPAANTEIPLTGSQVVTVNWTDIPAPAGPVGFSTSRGTIAPASSALAAGSASATASSTTAGPAIITASGPGGTPAATLDVIFVATSASTATVQAVPGTVQVTTGSASQTNNSSTVTVQVRDSKNNLVKNAGVNFTLTDTSGGRLTSASGVTDVYGRASVTYVAGGTSSAQNGVVVTANVTDIKGAPLAAPVTGSTNLTVSGQSLLVRLGTDNKVASSGTNNVKTYAAIVTDASGNPSVGTQVQFILRPGHYEKGQFFFDTLNKVWVQVFATVPACSNMDVNFNGILDSGEDAGFIWLDSTGNAVTPFLRPGAVATVISPATTDASGVATATITYPKDHSYWTEVTLEARTSVTSNDPPTWVTFYLPGPASDYTDAATPPPGQISPYGTDASCFDLF